MASLKGKTIFISGASRGIGLAMALRAARDGANITVAAKTTEPHPLLPGTIYTAAEEIEEAGGRALACRVDIRDEAQVQAAIDKTVETFGGIDIVINNASAISLTGTEYTKMKRYDLMHQVNVRGTFMTSKLAIPHLKKAENPHILNNSPPLNMKAHWFSPHVAYSMTKFGMSMCVLGMSDEFKEDGIAVNSIWPRTAIDTSAVRMLMGEEAAKSCRKPSIMADAAYYILTQPSRECTGNFFIDDEALTRFAGITNFDEYAVSPGHELAPDFFV